MSRDRLKEFLDGFGGRLILLGASGISALAMAIGAWFALQVWTRQDHIEQQVKIVSERIAILSEKIVAISGEKISRPEFDAKTDTMRRESLEQRAEMLSGMKDLKTELAHMNDILLSRSRPQGGQ